MINMFTQLLFVIVSNFRRDSNHVDLWNHLEHNWDSFFWLTGEVPPSLMIVVNDIEPLFHQRLNACGRKPKLSLRNQVV